MLPLHTFLFRILLIDLLRNRPIEHFSNYLHHKMNANKFIKHCISFSALSLFLFASSVSFSAFLFTLFHFLGVQLFFSPLRSEWITCLLIVSETEVFRVVRNIVCIWLNCMSFQVSVNFIGNVVQWYIIIMNGWIFAEPHTHTLYRIIIITATTTAPATATNKKTTQFAESHMKMCALAAYVCIKCTFASIVNSVALCLKHIGAAATCQNMYFSFTHTRKYTAHTYQLW